MLPYTALSPKLTAHWGRPPTKDNSLPRKLDLNDANNAQEELPSRHGGSEISTSAVSELYRIVMNNGEDDDDYGDGNREQALEGSDGNVHKGTLELPRPACPFYKLEPKTMDYHACAGPGFKSIQRLK
jgi:hypothetical protein